MRPISTEDGLKGELDLLIAPRLVSSKMREVEPQTVWGWLIAADFFFGGTGASLFLVSMVLRLYGVSGSLPQIGLVTGLAFVVTGLAFLVKHQWSRRGKFLEMMNRPRTSWISRGTIFNLIFLAFGILYVSPHWVGWLPWTQGQSLGVAMGVVAGVAAFLVVIYPGMFLSSLNSIPFWNSPIIPLLFISYGMTGALGTLSIASPFLVAASSSESPESLIWWQMLLLGCTMVLVALQLAWAFSSKMESRTSVIELTRGRLLGYFVVGSLVFGLFIPLIGTVFSLVTADITVSAFCGALILVGSLLHKYTVLAAGSYVQLVPASWPSPPNA
jgi:formate-dependent nitrite reductase membrane component NrfD